MIDITQNHQDLAEENMVLRRKITDLEKLQKDMVTKQAFETLKRCKENYAVAFLNNPIPMSITTISEGRYVDVNESFADAMDCSRYDLIGQTSTGVELITPEQRALFIQELNRNGFVRNYEMPMVLKNGETKYTLTSANKVTIDDHEGYLIVPSVDITDRVAAEKNLRESEARFRCLFDSFFGGIAILKGSIIIDANMMLSNMTGYSSSELIGMDGFQLVAPEWHDLVMNKGVSTYEKTYEALCIRKDRTTFFAEIHGATIPYHGTQVRVTEIRDITERKRIEEKVQQTQRLESLGVLAGGIAHDFNNLLMGILGNIELSLRELPKKSVLTNKLSTAKKACLQASDLCNQMLAYAGKGKYIPERINLNNLIVEMRDILGISVSKKVNVDYALSRELHDIEADATQIRQIILNLVINASEAISENDGFITINTGIMAYNPSWKSEVLYGDDLFEGYYVFLEVKDNGCGMDKEMQDRIFEPFFSTKFLGRGLGLATVIGIVKGHKGAVILKSSKDQGTSFRVIFPSAISQRSHGLADRSEESFFQRKGTILFVDDEDLVRNTGSKMLSSMGFDIITAEDGYKALEIFEQNPQIFDCIILDFTMPYFDGLQTLEALQNIKKDVNVIISSGFPEKMIGEKFKDKNIAGFIHKPYRMETLGNILFEAMVRGKSSI